MQLPEYVSRCLGLLGQAGYEAYTVGGCVRDWLLGLPIHDYDVCTSATPSQTKAVFAGYPLVLAGEKHGTVGVVCPEVVEITTFRTEGGYQDNRHPEWVKFVRSVTDDLARRDFTINAMAWSPEAGLIDPFGGQRDLQDGILRAVGDPALRFSEDALRILRGVRFAVRFRLTVEPQTMQAMEQQAHLLQSIARERVYEELCKLLPLVDAAQLLTFRRILGWAIPELVPTIGFDQHSPHHKYDVFTHIAYVTAGLPGDLTLRWAGLLHDVGKPAAFTTDENGRGHFKGHAAIGAEIADSALCKLKAPAALRKSVVFLVEHHMTRLPEDKRLLRRWLGKYGQTAVEQLLQLQQADMAGKGTDETEGLRQFPRLRQLIAQIAAEDSPLTVADLAVNGNDLKALGLQGRAIGQALTALLDAVQDEKVPNDRDELLHYLKNECHCEPVPQHWRGNPPNRSTPKQVSEVPGDSHGRFAPSE